MPRAVSNTPATSAGQGRPATPAASAAPVTVTASAVSNVIGCWLPNCRTTVARASQDTSTARPMAAHSRLPSMAIAAAQPPPDAVAAGCSGRSGGGAMAASPATAPVPFPCRVSMAPRFPGPVRPGDGASEAAHDCEYTIDRV